MQTRYDRQIIISEIGEKGQEKLRKSEVLLIGFGGLGTPCATYLAQAGIGRLEIIDADTVAFSNLNRQFFFTEQDIDLYKAHIAEKIIGKMNSGVNVRGRVLRIDEKNAEDCIQGFDIVVNYVDNIETRKIVHNACLKYDIPLVEGGIDSFYGFVSCIKKGYPCLNCMGFFDGKQKAVTPVLGAVAGIIGSMQAVEALKILLGVNGVLYGKILYYDAKRQETELVTIPGKRNCICHKR